MAEWYVVRCKWKVEEFESLSRYRENRKMTGT